MGGSGGRTSFVICPCFENAGVQAPALLTVRAVPPSGGWTETPHETASAGLGLRVKWKRGHICGAPLCAVRHPRTVRGLHQHAGLEERRDCTWGLRVSLLTLFLFKRKDNLLCEKAKK